MMLAPTIQKIIRSHADELGIDPDYIFSYTIDPNVRANDTSHIVILITEIDDTPSNYGSDQSIYRKADVQIQIFFPQTFTGDTSLMREKITKIMEHRRWSCTLDTGIEHDPSVDMLYNTGHWRKTY